MNEVGENKGKRERERERKGGGGGRKMGKCTDDVMRKYYVAAWANFMWKKEKEREKKR